MAFAPFDDKFRVDEDGFRYTLKKMIDNLKEDGFSILISIKCKLERAGFQILIIPGVRIHLSSD